MGCKALLPREQRRMTFARNARRASRESPLAEARREARTRNIKCCTTVWQEVSEEYLESAEVGLDSQRK